MPAKKIQQLAVIGDPISHSLSPAMQTAAIQRLKAPFRYRAIRVKPEGLKDFMRGKAKGLAGFNITIPHKEAAATLVDRLAFEAQLIGAVNTVLNKNGELIGF
ncbi:MAG: shikimate dehydrogenase, partial [Deltaproteobacteria bacterium]|nr:shikimate dehydrogenase [Deltaproteobacteria bacterium]